ncbi:hypothetical protein QYM36_003011, partial [Artemia franciscana]
NKLHNMGAERELLPSVVFNISKNEEFTLQDNFKELQKYLKASWKVLLQKDRIGPGTTGGCERLIVLPTPKEKFSEIEFNALRQHIENGGKLMVIAEQNMDKETETNIDFLLEEYGIMINQDCVIRVSPSGLFHPKECLISNVPLPQVSLVKNSRNIQSTKQFLVSNRKVSFLFPFGATLNVAKPAITIFTTGHFCHPLQRPIVAAYSHPKSGGKLLVVGSIQLFYDSYVKKHDNEEVVRLLFDFCMSDIRINDEKLSLNVEVTEYFSAPDVISLAEEPKVVFSQSEPLPADYMELFDTKFYSLDTSLLPEVLRNYEDIGVVHEMLRIIPPKFDIPHPPLQMAVFPPPFISFDPPAVELFDLEEAWKSNETNLSSVASKWLESRLESNILSGGNSIGINSESSRETLKKVLKDILSYKVGDV